MTMPYEAELQAALEAVERTRPLILAAYEQFQPIPDAAASISLPVDRETQEVLLRHLSAAFPGDAFCAEEATATMRQLAGVGSGRPRTWVIDPIDGTRGFAVKNGEFSVMVGLIEGGHVIVGVVLEPVRGRLTYATRGGGCWKRDGDGTPERCRVSSTDRLADAVLTVSHSSTGRKRSPQVDALGPVRLLPAYSAGLKLAHVARGEADLYLNVYPNFNDWDICAGQVLVEEAGGQVCTLSGQPLQYGHGRDQQRDGLLATNGRVQGEALAKLREGGGERMNHNILPSESSLREEAEYLRLGLAMGLITPDEVVAWADGLIVALDEPTIQVIDVSLAGSRSAVEIMDLLARVPGRGNLVAAAHRALGLLLRGFGVGSIPLEQAADMLWAYSNWASVPENERLSASNFTDVVYCLKQGYAGTPESARKEIEDFLSRHSAGATEAER